MNIGKYRRTLQVEPIDREAPKERTVERTPEKTPEKELVPA